MLNSITLVVILFQSTAHARCLENSGTEKDIEETTYNATSNEKKKSYADLGELQPLPRVSKVLTPNVVATTVAVLLLSSIVGIVVAIVVFSTRTSSPGYIGASEAFVIIACSVSILYLFLHYLAAVHNKAVGPSRPPQHKIHAFCFIVARLALVAWVIALIASSVVISKKSVCPDRKTACQLQIINMVASALAFLSCGIILTALESCQHPFQAPRACTGITCRVSSFGDVIDSPVSTGSSAVIQEKSSQGDKIIWQNNIKRKPVPKTSMSGEYVKGSPAKVSDRRMTPLLPSARIMSPRKSWGEEWKHLAEASEVKPTTLSKSLSLNSMSSIGSLSIISNSKGSLTKRQGRAKTVTPSSSISNLSRRSPLSKMRSVEFPDVVVCPELYVLPPKIPPPHEWSTTQPETLQQLLPIADMRALQRQASGMQRRPSAMIAPLAIQKYARHPPPSRHSSLIRNQSLNRHQPLSRHQSLRQPPAGGLVRRTTLDVRVPGAYIDYRLSHEGEAKVNEHARKIEVESRNIVRSQSGRASKPRSLPRMPRGEINGIRSPTRVNSKTRYRETRPRWPGPQRGNTVCGLRQHPPDMTYPSRSAMTSIKELRRLTLGDIDVDLGKLWEEV